MQGATEVALTCLDVLGYLEEIPVCTGYRLADRVLDTLPSQRLLEQVQPMYERLPGWRQPIQDARRMSDLPREAVRYVEHLESLIGVPVRMVSVGPHRDELIVRA